MARPRRPKKDAPMTKVPKSKRKVGVTYNAKDHARMASGRATPESDMEGLAAIAEFNQAYTSIERDDQSTTHHSADDQDIMRANSSPIGTPLDPQLCMIKREEYTPDIKEESPEFPDMSVSNGDDDRESRGASCNISRTVDDWYAHAGDATPAPSTEPELPENWQEQERLELQVAKLKKSLERKKEFDKNMDPVEAFRYEVEINQAEEKLRKLIRDRHHKQQFADKHKDLNSLSPDDDSSDDERLFVANDSPIGDVPIKRKRQPSPSGKARSKKTKAAVESDCDDEDADLTDDDRRERMRKKATLRRQARRQKKADATLLNISSIHGTNVFEDAQMNQTRPSQPTFNASKRRADAVKNLLASISDPSQRQAAKQDADRVNDAIACFDGNAVSAVDGGRWLVRGMQTPLQAYQILAAGFMRKRENGLALPRGGILADEMGLGKTMTSLGNLVNGQVKPLKGQHDQRIATLVVMPASIVDQWYDEILKHCYRYPASSQGLRDVLRYHTGHKLPEDKAKKMLRKASIVLTTYNEIQRSWPKNAPPPHLDTAAKKHEWFEEEKENKKGVLHKIRWLRIILDEGQMIKNHNSRTSQACRALDARHRWIVTGTPFYNNTDELYSYLRFLREPLTSSYRLYKKNYRVENGPDCEERLSVLLHSIMIRRTHQDTLYKAKLLDLPMPSSVDMRLEFTWIERKIYEIVKKRFTDNINRMMKKKEKTVFQQYNHVFTLILRLRQMCSHMLLAPDTFLDLLHREDFEELRQLAAEDFDDDTSKYIAHMRGALEHFQPSPDTTKQTLRLNQQMRTVPYDDKYAGGMFGRRQSYGLLLNELKERKRFGRTKQRAVCPSCNARPTLPYRTTCGHLYCYTCLNDIQELARREGHTQPACLRCCQRFDVVEEHCYGVTGDTDDDFESDPGETDKAVIRAVRKAKDIKWTSIRASMYSTKAAAIKAEILDRLHRYPDQKIIVFTQFMSLIGVLQKMCEWEGWSHLKFTGAMSLEARHQSVKKFESEPDIQILLASLKCGGLGLNLTMASSIIIVDSWWNGAVEAQAFHRVYRIGQTRETRLLRLVIDNTIDASMQNLKEAKQEGIDGLLKAAKEETKRDVRDLLRLFGEVRDDAEGIPFIVGEDMDLDDEGAPFRNDREVIENESDDEEGAMRDEE